MSFNLSLLNIVDFLQVEELKMNQMERRKTATVDRVEMEVKKERNFSMRFWFFINFLNPLCISRI